MTQTTYLEGSEKACGKANIWMPGGFKMVKTPGREGLNMVNDPNFGILELTLQESPVRTAVFPPTYARCWLAGGATKS